jgi:hypothetical protein
VYTSVVSAHVQSDGKVFPMLHLVYSDRTPCDLEEYSSMFRAHK